MNRELTEGHKIVLFLVYVAAIFFSQILAGVLEEKIYKVPYPNHTNTGSGDIFSDNITPIGFTSGIACLIGYFMIKEEQINFNIPIQKLVKVAACDLTTHILLITALLRTDYTTLIVVNSCSLLSVVLVGAFCSGVQHNRLRNDEGEVGQDQSESQQQNASEKIGSEKIWICVVVVIGTIIFSYSSPAKEGNHSAAVAGGFLVTFLIFALAITLEGFRPDFMAQVKHQYQPSPLFLYFSISGLTFILSMLTSIFTWKISYFITFILNHDRLLIDLTIYGLLVSLGVMFTYKLISIFRQHVYPLVAGTRKIFTVCVNVAWFGHHLTGLQWVGIFIVFTGVLIEIFNNYNLASKLLPNENIRNRQGQNYNKIIAKEQIEGSRRRYNLQQIGEDVEGI